MAKFFQMNNKEDNNTNDSDIYNFERGITSNDKKDVKINNPEERSEYSDHIHVDESPGKEKLYDRNNPLVKFVLLVLGMIALFGTIFYIWIYVTTM